jgi:hypothetical protein
VPTPHARSNGSGRTGRQRDAPPPFLTIDLGHDDVKTVRRTTDKPVRSIKAHRPRKATS